jgi:hypothetical protein
LHEWKVDVLSKDAWDTVSLIPDRWQRFPEYLDQLGLFLSPISAEANICNMNAPTQLASPFYNGKTADILLLGNYPRINAKHISLSGSVFLRMRMYLKVLDLTPWL